MTTPWLELLGRILVHFLWQGTLVAVALMATLAVLRRRGPESRYLACGGAMAAMVVLPLATLAYLLGAAADPGFARTAEATLVAPDPLAPVLPWIATFWLGGTSALQVRTVYWWIATRRLRRQGVSPLPHAWNACVGDLKQRLGLRQRVDVMQSSKAAVPMVVGWIRPVVLVPIRAFTGLDEDQLRAVLAHELAHVRRHDPWVNMLQIAVETLLFFHPAIWWVSRRLRIEREFCCDDLAVGVCGNPVVFARALGRLDRLRDPSPALAATGGSLMQRIERLLHDGDRSSRSFSSVTGLVLMALALSTGLIATGLAVASDDPPPPPPAPAPPAPVSEAAPVASAPVLPPAPESTPRPAGLRRLPPVPPAPPTPDVRPALAAVPKADPAVAAAPLARAPRAVEPVLATGPTEPLAMTHELPPAPEASTDAEIRRQIDEIRHLRRQLERRERRLLQMLETGTEPVPAEKVPAPVEPDSRQPFVN